MLITWGGGTLCICRPQRFKCVVFFNLDLRACVRYRRTILDVGVSQSREHVNRFDLCLENGIRPN